MKRVLILLSSLVAFAWVAVGTAAPTVGVVDMQQLMKQSPQVKKSSAQLNKEFASRKAKIIKLGKQLQANLKLYHKNKAVMNSKKLDSLKSKITAQEMQLRQAQTEFQRQAMAAQSKLMKKFRTDMIKSVKQIAAKEHLTLVLPKALVLYSQSTKDITSQVAREIK
jgi:Skp family chaperone for outer membrane proteins